MKNLKVAGCVVINDNYEVLLIHRINPDQWEVPGGKKRQKESIEFTAIREFREELGADVGNLALMGQAEIRNGDIEYTWFLGEIERGWPNPQETHKHDDVGYFDIITPNSVNIYSDGVLKLAEEIKSGRIILKN